MRISSSELTPLENIIHEITVSNNNFEDTQDCYDLKETIWIFLDDYLKDNIEIYKDKNFDEIVRQNVYDSMYVCYFETFNEIELKIDIDDDEREEVYRPHTEKITDFINEFHKFYNRKPAKDEITDHLKDSVNNDVLDKFFQGYMC